MKALQVITLWALGAAVLIACGGEHRDARDKYNEGVAALAKADFEPAEKALLDARSEAGVDPELVFRAAYDLGVAYGSHADKLRAGKDADLAKALELAQNAVWSFTDADRLKPGDADTKANLAIMHARVQAISDELRKAEGKLEARLDRLIGEQRGVLDGARAAWLAVKQAGGGDPLAEQGTLTHLADLERGILAEAGVVGDLASDETDSIGKKPDDQRSAEEKQRVVQLKNLDLYLLEGRTRITEARGKLQALAAEDGVGRVEAGLVALKRAREQLLDPIAVLRQIAQDEIAVSQDTGHSDVRALQLGSAADPKPAELPGWLQPPVIAERQLGVRDRLEEVRASMTAFSEAQPPAPPAGNDPKAQQAAQQAAEQAKLRERVIAALPAIGEASTAMDHARDALIGKQLPQAAEQEHAAVEAIAHAIEQFSDLKQLVEVAYGEHQQLLQLLGPEAAKALDAAERGKATREALARNLARMPRLKELIADEVAKLAAKASEPVDPKADPKQAEAQKQQLEQQQQLYTRAEELRGEALTALTALDKALAGADPMPPAKDADQKLGELRKLFFDLIQHLQELIREQGETRDQASAANADDDATRQAKLPPLVEHQDGHGKLAKAISDELAAHADQMAKQPPQQGQPQQGPDAKAYAGAADEVRQGETDMADALAGLQKAVTTTTQSVSLDPATKSQGKAIEHLENALKLLQPPKKNDKQEQQQQQQQQKPAQPQKQGGAGQRARDEDAKRQRDKNQPTSDPVEKDW